jgi:hypothetical protein
VFVYTPINEGLEVLWQLLPTDERGRPLFATPKAPHAGCKVTLQSTGAAEAFHTLANSEEGIWMHIAPPPASSSRSVCFPGVITSKLFEVWGIELIEFIGNPAKFEGFSGLVNPYFTSHGAF